MANVPQYDTRNFSFGPGILYIAPYDVTNDKPTYPKTDVGAVKAGAVLRVTREILDVVQGAPDLIVKSFVRSETVEFNINLFGKRFYEIFPENVKINRIHILFDEDNLPPRIGIEGTAKQEEFESLILNSGFGETDDWYRKKFLQIV